MSERIRLSLWFADNDEAELLPRLALAVNALPPESVAAGARAATVQAIDWSEPPVFEVRPKQGLPVEDALKQMAEFIHADCAAELEMAWPLWVHEDEWRSEQRAVSCLSVGSGFAAGAAVTDGQVQVDFGLDEIFLAEMAPWTRDARLHLQTNILQLLGYCQQLQRVLNPVRLRLWSDTAADWSARLTQRLQLAESMIQ